MASPTENDEFPILPIPEATSRAHTRTFTSRNRSLSLSNPTFSTDRFDNSTVPLGYTGPLRTQRIRPPLVQMSGPLYSTRRPEPLFPTSPQQPPHYSTVDVPPEDDFVFKNANLLRSGQLGMCNDPYCTTCPSYYNRQAAQFHTSRVSASRFHTALYDDARGWARRFASSVRRCLPGIMNPHSKVVQGWTRILAFSSLLAIFIDPLFLFLLFIRHDKKCIEIDGPRTKLLVSLRFITDLIFFLNILLQFRLAYVAPESRIVGAGQLVDHPRKIVRHYFRGKFFLDLLIVLPIPQVMILWIIPAHLGIPREESEKNIIRVTVLLQYIPKLYRLLPLIAGQTPTGFIFESAWANFIINLLTFMLAGHAVGSCWYLAGLQRVKKCMLKAWNISAVERRNLIDCARGSHASPSQRDLWNKSASVNACFEENGFSFGIYLKAVNLTHQPYFTRFSYSLFWGFQEDGNDAPSNSGPLRTQRRPPLVQMSGPLSSTRKPEPLFLPHPSSASSDSIGVSSQPERYPSFAALEHKKSSDDEFVLKHANLLRSGQLGMCNDPYCTICPSYYNRKAAQIPTSRVSSLFDSTFHNALYDDAKGWARRLASSVNRYLPGIMNPHAKVVQSWTKFFALSCLLAIFIDPLFFFLILVDEPKKCIVIDWPMTKAFVAVRTVTDIIFSVNILLQFRLAYVAPESTVVGAGQLVSQPKKIALNYFRGKFFLDLFIVMPLPQILILWVIPERLGTSGANYAKNLLRAAVLFQYIPKLYRLLPFLAGQTPTGFIFESAWANFVINLLTFMLAGHVVGSCWYLFGLQRVNQCLRNACGNSERECIDLIDCGNAINNRSVRAAWRNNASANACFQEDGFPYGIYLKAVNLTNHSSLFTRYSYSLFWGFQQISTLAGNQNPSYFLGEVFFTMGIIGLGLLLFALLIGNMQNFLQALGKRNMEMTLRRRDVEQWMSHRRLPDGIRKRVREAERFNWAATRGVNEDSLFENMPDDLQRDIRRHLFKFLKKVRIFSVMDESILDAIRERLKQRTYIGSSTVLHRGGLVEKMVFIVRGEMESIGEDGSVLPLSEGDVCGEELLTWCLERSSVNPDGTRIRMPSKGLLSNRNVRCVTNVEAFSLSVADLEDVTSLFSRFLRSHRVQGAIRYESPYWRLRAARQIQVAWRYRRRRLQRYCSV